MKRQMSKRILSALLSLVMLISLLPVSVFAEEPGDTFTATKITADDQLVTGQYVMVAGDYAPGVLDGTWVTAKTVSTPDASSPVWTITVTGNTAVLTDANGASIAPKGGNNNGIITGSYSWVVECADGTFTFSGQGTDTVILASNKSADGKFRAYKTTTVSGNPTGYPSNFTLYKVEGGSGSVTETVATPTASPAAGEIAKGTAVSFACTTEGATIYYKTTGEYVEYTAPVEVNEDTTFTVKATKGGNSSAEATFAYTVKSDEAEKPWKDVEAKYSIYELVDAPQDGDVVLLYNPNSGKAVTATDPNGNARNLSGDAETPTDGYIAIDIADVADKAVEWTVSVDTDGAFSFAQGEKKLAATKNSETSFYLSSDATGSTKWTLSDSVAANKTHYIASSDLTGTYGNVYVEW